MMAMGFALLPPRRLPLIQDLADNAFEGRGYFTVHLIGGDLQHCFVQGYGIAFFTPAI